MRCPMKDNENNKVKVELKLKVGVIDSKGVVRRFDAKKCKQWGDWSNNNLEKDK